MSTISLYKGDVLKTFDKLQSFGYRCDCVTV